MSEGGSRAARASLASVIAGPVMLALILLTAWSTVRHYRDLQAVTQAGLDARLLAVSQGSAGFVEVEQIDAIRRRLDLTALAPGPRAGTLLGATRADRSIWLLELEGGAPVQVGEAPDGPRDLAWLPDRGELVLLERHGGQLLRQRWSATEAWLLESHTEPAPDPDAAVGSASTPEELMGITWMPDGGQLVGVGRTRLHLLDPLTLQSRDTVALSPPLPAGVAPGLTWVEERGRLAMQHLTGEVLWLDPTDGGVVSVPRPVVEPPPQEGEQLLEDGPRCRAVWWEGRPRSGLAALDQGAELYTHADGLLELDPVNQRATPRGLPHHGWDPLATAGGRCSPGDAGLAMCSVLAPLRLVQDALGTRYLYVFEPEARVDELAEVECRSPGELTERGAVRYLADASLDDDHSDLGDLDLLPRGTLAPLNHALAQGQGYIGPEVEWDGWGRLQTAYTPVLRPDGQLAAVIGADLEVSAVQAETSRLLPFMSVIAIGCVLLAGLVLSATSRRLAEPVKHLEHRARLAARGEPLTPLEGLRLRELAELDRLLGLLALDLEALHSSGRAELEELEERLVADDLDRALHRQERTQGEDDPRMAVVRSGEGRTAGCVRDGMRAAAWGPAGVEPAEGSLLRRARCARAARVVLSRRRPLRLAAEELDDLLGHGGVVVDGEQRRLKVGAGGGLTVMELRFTGIEVAVPEPGSSLSLPPDAATIVGSEALVLALLEHTSSRDLQLLADRRADGLTAGLLVAISELDPVPDGVLVVLGMDSRREAT